MIEAIQSTSFRNGSSRGVSPKRRDESTTLVGHRFDSPLEAGASTASETAAEPSIQAHVGRIHQRPALYAANERRAYQTMVRENAKFHLIHSFNGNLGDRCAAHGRERTLSSNTSLVVCSCKIDN